MSTSVSEARVSCKADNRAAEVRIQEAAGRVLLTHVGFRVRRGRLAYQRRLTDAQKDKAAQQFNAEARSLSMSKKLFDAKEPAVKRVRAAQTAITAVFENPEYTLPCPTEYATRLVKRGQVDFVDREMTRLQSELAKAAAGLAAELEDIRKRQEWRLGDLYNSRDYAFDPEEACYVSWDFPSIHLVDDTLQNVSPRAYEQQLQRVRETYEQSCQAKQEEMALALYEMLDHLVFALEGARDNGKPKIFKDTTVTRVFEALDHADYQLHENGIGRGPLKAVFDQLRQTVRGRRESLSQQLRDDTGEFRDRVRQQLVGVGRALENLAEIRPRRAVLRKRAISAAFSAQDAGNGQAHQKEE